MKILYFCNERLDAQNLATALRSIAKNGTVSWTSSLDRAAKWLDENKDVAALVVEAQTDGGTGASVLKHVRGLALRPAVVVVVPEGTGPRLGMLAAAADDLVDKSSARFSDLPGIVTRAVGRLRDAAQPRQSQRAQTDRTSSQVAAAPAAPDPVPERRADIERKLAYANAALKEAEQRHLAAMSAASEQLAERQVKYDLAMARATARWQIVDEQLRTAAMEAESARQSQAAAASELDRVTQRESQVSSQLADAWAKWQATDEQLRTASKESESARQRQAALATQLDRLTQRESALSTQLAEAEARWQKADEQLRTAAIEAESTRQRQAALDAQLDQLTQREIALFSQLSEAEARRQTADEQLRAAAIEAESARQRQAAAAAELDRLSHRESDLTSRLAEADANNDTLAKRVADAEVALEAAQTRAAQERVAAAEQLSVQQHELQSQIAAAAAERRTLEATLAQAVRARDDAESRRAAAMLDAAAQLRELDAALRLARDDQASTAAEVERLTQREAALNATLAGVTANHDNLERRLAATQAAFQDADTRATSERLEVTRKAAAREAELDSQIRQERAKHVSLQEAIAAADAARREAQQQHESALAKAAQELSEQQAHATRELTQATADRERATQRLADLEGSLVRSRAEHRSAVTEVERLNQREADLISQIDSVSAQLADVRAAHETLAEELDDAKSAIEKAISRETELEDRIQQQSATRASLEQAVADVEAALRDARQQHEAAMTRAAQDLSERQAQFDRERSEGVAERNLLTQRVNEVEDTLAHVRSDHQSAAADVARLTGREAELVSQVADVQSARQKLELQLTQTTENAAAREAALDEQLRQASARRAELEQAIVEAETARRDDQKRHDSALATAARELAEHQTRFDRELSKTVADRNRLNQRLSEVEGTLEQVRKDHRAAKADLKRLTQREADLTSQIAEVRAARESVEGELAEAVKTIAETNEHAARDRAQAAEREADLRAQLAREIDARTTLARSLDETRSAAADAERSFQEQADALRASAREQKAAFNDQLAHERLDHQSRLTELQDRHRALVLERNRVQQSLAAAQEHATQLDADLRAAREQSEQARTAAHAESQRLTTALGEAARQLDEARSEFHTTLGRRDTEHAAALDARHGEIRHLVEKVTTTVRELESTKRGLDAVRAEADKVPNLQKELEDSQSESARLFQQAGLAMFRCSRRGELLQTNRAGMTLVGRRTIDDLRGRQFSAAVFEDPNGLPWLIERCLSTRTREAIETTWRRKDGGRLFVRLSAYASSPDVIEIVAEDLTRVRVLQERLGQAHRMEAVGRLASEVAVTCGNLLTDVHHNVQEWLVSAPGSASSRQQGEHLIAELTRAAGFLRQLAAYGEEQARTPAVADLNTVIRDLEPVLKRVAGDGVDVQLSDASSRLNVDVGTERIERLLVNLASFGRARMPFGGQLKIELGSTVVDRRFVAKHPNVRLGPHALITVTERRHARKADGLLQLRDKAADRPAEKAEQKPGMDFGTLQGLVGGCGGHLWMTVQPQGDMVAKIHLPLLNAFDQPATRGMAARGVRERALARLFHH